MRLKRFFLLLIFVFAIVGIIGFYMNTTYLDTLIVEGNIHNTREEVLDYVGIHDTSSLLNIMLNRVYLIENKGYIDTIEIEYIDMKNVRVKVVEKEVIGYANYMGKYLCIDANGYIIDYTDNPNIDKPKIRGVTFTNFTLEAPFDVTREVIDSIATIYRLSRAFNINLDWIDFKYTEGDDIVLSTRQIEIYIGDVVKIEEKFEIMKEILDVLPETEKGILHIENVDGNIIFQSTLETLEELIDNPEEELFDVEDDSDELSGDDVQE